MHRRGRARGPALPRQVGESFRLCQLRCHFWRQKSSCRSHLTPDPYKGTSAANSNQVSLAGTRHGKTQAQCSGPFSEVLASSEAFLTPSESSKSPLSIGNQARIAARSFKAVFGRFFAEIRQTLPPRAPRNCTCRNRPWAIEPSVGSAKFGSAVVELGRGKTT